MKYVVSSSCLKFFMRANWSWYFLESKLNCCVMGVQCCIVYSDGAIVSKDVNGCFCHC